MSAPLPSTLSASLPRILKSSISALLLGIVALSLTSCGADPRWQTTRPDKIEGSFEASGKAIVIMSAEMLERGLLGTVDRPMSLTFENRTPARVVENGETVEKRWFTVQYDYTRAYAIDPGHYAVRYLSVQREQRIASFETPPWDTTTNKPVAFGFSVKPGEVVYLGHIVLRPLSDEAYAIGIGIEDRSTRATRAIERAFDDKAAATITAKMQTRLIDAPPKAW